MSALLLRLAGPTQAWDSRRRASQYDSRHGSHVGPIWRDAAENVAESLTRGTRVIVTGRLKSRSYDKDGEKRTVIELVTPRAEQ